MFAKSVIALAAVAGLTAAAPIEQRGAPAGWAYGYLEDYDTYHIRYLALKCYDQHNTSFFQDCCRPMLATENLQDNRKPYCIPSQNATDYVVSSLSAKAAGATATSSALPEASSTDCEDDDAPSTSSAAAAPTSSAAVTTAAAPAAAVPSSSSTTTTQAKTTSPAADNYVAPAPSSSSTTTTQAWTPAPTTQAPATTQAQQQQQQSSNKQQFSGGYATYFWQNGNAGACGNVNSDYAMIAAIDHDQWGSDQSYGSGSNTCGRWLTVCNSNNGKCVSVMVADVCPTCANGNSLDLSYGAFTAIASQSDGMVPITWSWN